ncbi:MAG: hypothetical protein HY235_16865 [Acidobacteria bacterium]|nr:hypothetical protein [Acidobacteriota bacterium]
MTLAGRATALILLTAALIAAKPNFSGEWKMDPSKSDFGPNPAPEKIVRTIQHDDPNLAIKTLLVSQQGEIASGLKYTTDGKECTNTTRFGEAKGTAKWDGDTLVIESKLQFQGADIVQKDRWTLSSDGKAMKVQTSIKSPQGEIEMAISFDKQ